MPQAAYSCYDHYGAGGRYGAGYGYYNNQGYGNAQMYPGRFRPYHLKIPGGPKMACAAIRRRAIEGHALSTL